MNIEWGTKIINVLKADMTQIQSSPTSIYEMDIDDFRATLNDLSDDAEGMPFDTTHQHVAPVSLGGVDLARVIEIINGYSITFEDGQYAVNLIGANSNIADKVNVNQVSIRSANSAGLVDSGLTTSGIVDAVWDEAISGHQTGGSTGETLNSSGGGTTPSAIADAVWDEAITGHTTAGTFGEKVSKKLLTLAQWVGLKD